MTANSLYGILNFIVELDKQLRLQASLDQIKDSLNNIVNHSAQPQYQSALASALDSLSKAAAILATSITPSQATTIAEIGGEESFDPKIAEKVKASISANAMTPSVARDFVQNLATQRSAFLATARETECIAKGKLRKPYEFGHKVGIVTTARHQFVLGALLLAHKPYDGHTLASCIEQAERIMGQQIGGEIYVDRGYRGHNYQGPAQVLIAKPKRKQEPDRQRWYRKRNGIEATISHMKNDGWLGRNYLKGYLGSRINALLAACGQNLRKLFNGLATRPLAIFCAFLQMLLLGPTVEQQNA